MDLYFAPMACSLAARITIYETGAAVRFIEVDTRDKRVEDGSDFCAVNPLGQVPVLRTDGGHLLTENAAVLQYLAELHPEAGLIPADLEGRARLRQWLGFISTELHKVVFVPLLDPQAPAEVKAYSVARVKRRLDVLEDRFAAHPYLLDSYSVADAYLTAVLNWAPFVGVKLGDWPAVKAWHDGITARPHTARAIGEEFERWRAEQARRNR